MTGNVATPGFVKSLPAPQARTIGWLLAAIVLAGAALRIHFLNSALWYDEIVTLVESVRIPLGDLVTHFPSNNNHALYSLLARISTTLFGEHPWSLRLPAAIFGIASLPMLYVLGTRVTSRFEALSATILLTVSYHHVWFSQNARGYTILLFCALLTTHLLLIGLRDDRRSPYVQYGVVAALSAYTHLTMILFVLGQAAVVAAKIIARRRWQFSLSDWKNPALGFVIAGLLTGLLYAPMLGDVKAFFTQERTGPAVATVGWAVWETIRGLQLGYTMGGALVVGGALFLVGCWSYWRQSPLVLGLFLIPGATLFAVTVLLQRPTFPRFFFFMAGFALLIVVRGAVTAGEVIARRLPRRLAGEPKRQWVPMLLIAGMVIVSIAALPSAYRYPKQDYEQALRFVDASAKGGDMIAVAGGGTAIPYQTFYGKPWKRVSDAAELAAMRRQYEAVWLLYTFSRYIEILEPDLMNEIRARCMIVRTFPGSVADGAIIVTRCSAS